MQRIGRGMFEAAPAWADPLVLMLLFGFTLFHSLGAAPLLNPDEGRYAEIPREMLESGDFITPRLDYVVYFEKPPLYHWLNALSFTIFGENEFGARFFSALSGLAGILLTWHIGRRVFGRRAGMISVLVLGTSIGYLAQGRLAIIDMLLTCLLTASLGSFLLATKSEGRRKGLCYFLFYLFAALAVLAKGLIGIMLPAAIVLLYMALGRRWRLLGEMKIPGGVTLFLLVVAPWFIAVTIRNPEFPRFFFIHEHLQRYLTVAHHRYEPFWFFIPVLAGLIFPWSCFLPAAIAGLRRRDGGGGRDSRIFLAAWAGLIFCFFSLSGSKLVPYILPVLPPVALLIGETLAALWDGGLRSIRREAWFLHAVLLAGAASILLYSLLAPNPLIGPFGCAAIAVLLLAEALLVGACRRRSSAAGLVLALCVMTYMEGIFGPPFVIAGMLGKRSCKGLARAAAKTIRPGDTVVCYSSYPQDIPFYLKRRVVIVGKNGDLQFGSGFGDQSAWFIDYATLLRRWDSSERLFVLVDTDDDAAFRKDVAVPGTTLGREGTMLLVTNR